MHVGLADSLLNLCQNQARFQGLKQYELHRVLEDGSRIAAKTIFGQSQVIIDTPPLKPPVEDEFSFIEIPRPVLWVMSFTDYEYAYDHNTSPEYDYWATMLEEYRTFGIGPDKAIVPILLCGLLPPSPDCEIFWPREASVPESLLPASSGPHAGPWGPYTEFPEWVTYRSISRPTTFEELKEAFLSATGLGAGLLPAGHPVVEQIARAGKIPVMYTGTEFHLLVNIDWRNPRMYVQYPYDPPPWWVDPLFPAVDEFLAWLEGLNDLEEWTMPITIAYQIMFPAESWLFGAANFVYDYVRYELGIIHDFEQGE